ncbi:unnamed protein product [Pieris brassicae]|uniref:Uncharacterized protein n=1 Tax=Pieris brassicae TaxID=7116 RepID=A0A9P0SH07_PIEBR|nr:unnamed protein product [Pieris brassicae]
MELRASAGKGGGRHVGESPPAALALRSSALPGPWLSPPCGVSLTECVAHPRNPEVPDLWIGPFATFDNPAPCFSPSCISISAKSAFATRDRRLLPPLFMLSLWCGEYLCCTDKYRIICALEFVDITNELWFFRED